MEVIGLTDDQIIDLFWARNEQAIACTDHVYGHKLQNVAGRILDSREDSEECVSDTYMKAWLSIPPQRPTYLFAFLAKICRHLAFGKLDWDNALKRKAEVVTLSEEMQLCVPDIGLEQKLAGEEIGQLLNEFLAVTPQESRMIFLRRYWYGESVAEIALRFGFTQSKVKTSLHRTWEKLRVFLEKEGIAV